MLISESIQKIVCFSFLRTFVPRNKKQKQKKPIPMKIDWNLVVTLLLVSVAVKVLDKLFLDKALEKIGSYETYETYEEIK
jgi:hypothetical protein